MFRRKYHPIALTLIGLGALGLLVKIFTDPLGLLTTLAVAAAVIAIFVFLYRRFVRKTSGRGVSDYRRAARKSAKLQKKRAHKPRRPAYLKLVNSKSFLPKKTDKDSLRKRKKDHQLTVIDGKKRKKKNRALF
ncbi:MAG TPA: SA1362 family protein [Bacillales bacterium]|nr:SA1362 family protein [Bacillales bacterium]